MTMAGGGRRRVLFIGEGATLAHAARPLALAAALPQDRYEAILAAPDRYRRFAPPHVRWLPLDAQTPEAFAERLRRGEPVFSRKLLDRYVEQDLALMRALKPDVVVGDLRLSLAASARLAAVPYVNLTNACWSPDRPLRARRPSLDMFRLWPGPLADLAFAALGRLALRRHASPMHRLMEAHGMGGLDRDIRRAFTEADVALYADLPGLFPDTPTSYRRRFLGPVSWEPPVGLPDWWDRVPDDRPVVYLTLGSSGDGRMLGRLSTWLVDLGHAVIVASAGHGGVKGDGRRLFVADLLPGAAAAARSWFVICNGGSPTATQALLAGRPVIGIAGNFDQFLNMRALEHRGAGLTLRADTLHRRGLERAVAAIRAPRFAEAASGLRTGSLGWNPATVLAGVVDELRP